MKLNFEVEGSDTWQMVTCKDLCWVSSNAQATYFATHCSGKPFAWNGGMGVTVWKVWFYHLVFPVLWLRAELLNLIWITSLVSLATCLLSWLLSWCGTCWLKGSCWECCVCKLYWWHDYFVLLLHLPNICQILLCEKRCNFLPGRIFFKLFV